MIFDNLTHDNFLLFAAKHYISPHYIEQEFFTDLKKIKYIKRLIQKHRLNGNLKERLILNHIILLYNVFETEPCTRMLFLKMGSDNYDTLKTFLIFLNLMPDIIENINGKNIRSSDINIDLVVADVLRQI
jgi:hypothetical protein